MSSQEAVLSSAIQYGSPSPPKATSVLASHAKSASPPPRNTPHESPPPEEEPATFEGPTDALGPNAENPTPQAQSLSPPGSRHTPVHSPPRSKSADAQVQVQVPIDPSLLGLGGEADKWVKSNSTSPDRSHNPSPVEDIQGQVQNGLQASQQPFQPVQQQGNAFLTDPTALAPWPLSTSNLQVSESQPPTTNTSSPATPGLGIDGLYHGRPYDLSRQSSMTDFGSYLGATRGMSTTASSEDGYDPNLDMEMNNGQDGDGDGGGIPPPKPKKSHARKQPPGHIKRARNAFILFRKHVTDSNLIPTSVEVKHQNISVVAAKMWREAPQEVRQKFQEQARLEKEEHQRKYPGYRYQPVFRRTDIIRRRVRKDPAEDEKVDAVAEALIKGKAGGDLEQEIREQMVARSEASDSEAEGSRGGSSNAGGRRRRREVGQLSKGAIRAQRAQARAKQMRQNLLGSNLLNMSMYNAAAQRGQIPNHPGAQHHLQYPMAEPYIPVGYDLEGQPIQYDHQLYGAPPPMMDSNDMYRLPPIDGMGGGAYDTWGAQPGMEYWSGEHVGQSYTHGIGAHDGHPPIETYYPRSMTVPDYTRDGPGQDDTHLGQAGLHNEYQLAPLLTTQLTHPHVATESAEQEPRYDEREKEGDPRMREWARDGNQTPSGHVIFNERLFDGALGSAGLPALLDGVGRDDGLAGFDEAMAQANEATPW